MFVINTIDDNKFSLNGVSFLRRYMSTVLNDTITIKNAYTSEVLVSGNYADFTVNGLTFGTAALVQNALVTVLYNGFPSIPMGWQGLTLLNGWVSNTVSGYAPPAYYKDALGIVHMRGLIKFGNDAVVAFVLPTAFRPQYHLVFPSNPQAFNLTTNGTYIEVQSNGNCYINGVSGNAYVSLDVVSFSTNNL